MAITYKDVCTAAEKLSQRNITVSVRNVREITKGSHSQIAPFVEQWKKDNPPAQPVFPAAIHRAVIDHLKDIHSNHEADLREEREIQDDLQKQLDEKDTALKAAEKNAALLEAKVEGFEKEIGVLNMQMQSTQSQLQNAVTEISKRDVLIGALQNQLEANKEILTNLTKQ
jgi:septal ring factor EnvC (AmiA/AmiB activator)